MSLQTFKRLEKKLLIDEKLLPKFIEGISEYMNPDEFNLGGKPYHICNLYFDNDNDDVIRHSVSKPKFKEKLRMRSYGTPNDDTKVFIELKKKTYGVGTKRRAKIKLSDAKKYIETGVHPENLSYLDERVLCEIDYFRETYNVYPKVYISYMRNAYFGKDDKNLRLTIDRDILTRRYDVSLDMGSYGEPILPEGKILVEVKFAGVVPLWLAHLMDELGLSFGTFSKYGVEFKKLKYRQVFEEYIEDNESEIINNGMA